MLQSRDNRVRESDSQECAQTMGGLNLRLPRGSVPGSDEFW